ncbi:jhy protein homolog [Rhinatrema bivittatum]|uniref:jhy protein homolog n=1 Tax=Rhinatrema bivittatum TaxID=194408 RepID=UPI00112BB0DA|nr:jhy protein homolog [Rhinatrema bivittatum]
MNQSGPMEEILSKSAVHGPRSKAIPKIKFFFDEDVHLSLHSSHETDSESLAEEIKYQSELKHWINENGEPIDHSSDHFYDSLNEDDDDAECIKESKLNTQGHMNISNSNDYTVLQQHSDRRRHRVEDRYADLRYDPDWKVKKEEATSTDLGRLQQLELENVLQDSLQPSPSPFVEEATQEKLQRKHTQAGQEQRGPGNRDITASNGPKYQQVLFPPHVPENESNSEMHDSVFPNNKQFLDSSNQLNEASHKHRKVQKPLVVSQQDKASDLSSKDIYFPGLPYEQSGQPAEENSVCSSDDPGKVSDSKRQALNQNHPKHAMAEKDFIEKNKLTLGLAAQKQNSYLQMHKTKHGESNQEQIAYIDDVVDAPTQNVREDELDILDPETKWKQKAQRLKHHKNASFQSDRMNSNHIQQSRTSKPRDKQRPARREKQSVPNQKHLLGNIMEFENTNMKPETFEELGLETDDSSSSCYLWNANVSVNPIRPSIEHSPPTMNWKANLKPLANINSSVVQNHKQATISFISPKYPPEETSSKDSTGYSRSQAYIGRHLEEYQPLYNYSYPLIAEGYVLQSQSRALATLSTHGQESGPESHIKGVSAVRSYQGSDGSWHLLSPSLNHLVASSSTTQFTRMMGQPLYQVPPLADFHHGESLFSNPVLPPILSRVESDSTLYDERSNERSEATMSRSNSEGCLFQMETQKQLKDKSNRKIIRLKGYMNQEVKLGGLGPDYEAIKEKSEQLKQQKEYAKRVHEHNKKNILNTMKSPAKPVTKHENKSSVARLKALEYAKKVPKPKLHIPSNPSIQEANEEYFMMNATEGKMFPQITLLEELQYRHEKEKEAVAALRMLHIL